MEKIKITIEKNKTTGMHSVYLSPNKNTLLFGFEVNNWDNNIRFYPDLSAHSFLGRSVIIEGGLGDRFPLDYFIRLVQAKILVDFGVEDWPEVELTKTALNILKIK
jgi:hypothetical protein